MSDRATLPAELWIEIFTLLVRGIESFRSTFHPTDGPLLPLTSVCSEWRNLAISTPLLWSRIQLCINQKTLERQRESIGKLVELWMERSKDSPLTIILFEHHRNRNVNAVPADSLPPRILQESNRWESLSLRIKALPVSFARFSSLEGNLAMLHSLTIVPTKRSLTQLPFEQPPLTFIANAPQLRVIRLMVGEALFRTNLSFKNLTTVDLVPDPFCFHFPLSVSQCLMVIERCPNLTHTRLNCGPVDGHLPRPQAVHHDSLRELDIFETHTFRGPPGTGLLLTLLHARFLTGLSVISDANSPIPRAAQAVWDHKAMSDFLSRSGRSLERLELFSPNNKIHVEEGIGYVHQSPNVRWFRLNTYHDPAVHVNSDNLKQLIRKDGVWPASLPRLSYWLIPAKKMLTVTSYPQVGKERYEGGCLYEC